MAWCGTTVALKKIGCPRPDYTKIMNAGGSNEDDYLSTCVICFNVYNLLMNRPKVLPCSHIFCFSCLQKMISLRKPLECPMCRKTAVGIDRVESLPNNVHAEHIILLNEKLEKAQATIQEKEIETRKESQASEIHIMKANHAEKIAKTKTKVWCYNQCGSEGIYHCCVNVSYCTTNCQKKHWKKGDHRRNCRMKRAIPVIDVE